MKKILGRLKKIKSKLTKKRVLVIVILLLVVFGIFLIRSRKNKKEFETTTIQKGNVSEDLILTGEIKATEHAILYFPTSGKISWVGVTEGDEVKKGQALLSLDKTTLNAAYQTALNNVRMYEADVEYVHDTLKNKESTENFQEKDTRTTAEVAKDNAYDALRAAEYNLRNSTLVSPFAGTVTYLAHFFPLVNISFSEAQVEILNPSSIYFDVAADQSEVVNLKKDQEVNIVLDSFPENILKGKVSFIGLTPKSGETGTVYTVKVIFENQSNMESIKVGMTGDAKFSLNKIEDVLYLAPSFVHSDTKGKYINLGNPKNKVYIEIGLEGEESVQIKGNVKEGDLVYE